MKLNGPRADVITINLIPNTLYFKSYDIVLNAGSTLSGILPHQGGNSIQLLSFLMASEDGSQDKCHLCWTSQVGGAGGGPPEV